MEYRRIRDLREDSDKTQQDLADYLKVARGTYRNYENGWRGIPSAIWSELADYYGTSVDFLMGKTNIKEPYSRLKK